MCKICNEASIWNKQNDGYNELIKLVHESFYNTTNINGLALFNTKFAKNQLFHIFLNALPCDEAKRHYNCHTCRSFFNNYGGLVYVNTENELVSAVWNLTDYTAKQIPEFFAPAIKALKEAVESSTIKSAFKAKHNTLGCREKGDFHHFYLSAPPSIIGRTVKYASNIEVNKNCLINFMKKPWATVDVIDKAIDLIDHNALNNGKGFRDKAIYHRDFIIKMNALKGNARNNFLWQCSVESEGYTHVNGSVLGTLYEDLATKDVNDAIRRWNDMVAPNHYMRPTAAPSLGNIERAEEIIKELGLTDSLARRYATFDEIKPFAVWLPAEDTAESSKGIFDNLRKTAEGKSKASVDCNYSSPIDISWTKFCKDILPTAKSIKFISFMGSIRRNFTAITTAANADSKPIFIWDSENDRNQFSSYAYVHGSTIGDWNLYNTSINVTAIAPNARFMKQSNIGKQTTGDAYILILEGCKDTRYKTCGLGLFPNTLIKDLFEVRSTIEAFSVQGTILGYEESSACGIAIMQSTTSNELLLEVDSGIAKYRYMIKYYD